jgi:hypothetical protein
MNLGSLPAFFGALLLAACGSSSGGGNGGHGGTSTGSNTGGASSSSSASSSSGAGGGCQGDSATWAQLTAGPFACSTDADCCVIVNGCTNEAQVVSKANQAAAKAAWPYCENQCTDCIPPAVLVGCVGGTCVGQTVPLPDASADLLMDHCGTAPVGGSANTLHFTCGGGG